MQKGTFEKYLIQSLAGLGIRQDDPRIELLVEHHKALQSFNRIVNLSALDKPSQIAYYLFADSLIPMDFINSLEGPSILDIGPGGGFPSIPLRIFTNENISFTLVEKRKKVFFFLEELISSLSLSNIKLVSGKIEERSPLESLDDKFDIVLNKAVFKGDFFLSLISDLVNENGLALHWTKRGLEKKITTPGWVLEKILDPHDKKFPGVVAVYRHSGI